MTGAFTMGGHFGTTGMWYKDGVFYELEDTHVNFFLNHYEILGFSIEYLFVISSIRIKLAINNF